MSTRFSLERVKLNALFETFPQNVNSTSNLQKKSSSHGQEIFRREREGVDEA